MLYVLDNDADIYKYADDNSLVCSGYDYDDVKSKLLSNVNNVIKWFESNHMKVDKDKLCIMFGKKGNLGNFRFGDHEIVQNWSWKCQVTRFACWSKKKTISWPLLYSRRPLAAPDIII